MESLQGNGGGSCRIYESGWGGGIFFFLSPIFSFFMICLIFFFNKITYYSNFRIFDNRQVFVLVPRKIPLSKREEQKVLENTSTLLVDRVLVARQS